MNQPPYQLPPIVKGEGCYLLDVRYLGEQLNKTGSSLEEMLESYWRFVRKCNKKNARHEDTLRDLPVKLGRAIYPTQS
jgi:hypothetical protein